MIKVAVLVTINPKNIVRMDLLPDVNGEPVVSVWEKDNKKSQFYEFPATNGYEIHLINEFLRSLDLGIDIEFKTFSQYGELIWECNDLLEKKKAIA